MRSSFAQALSQEKLTPAAARASSPWRWRPGADLKFAAVFEVMPEVQRRRRSTALPSSARRATVTESRHRCDAREHAPPAPDFHRGRAPGAGHRSGHVIDYNGQHRRRSRSRAAMARDINVDHRLAPVDAGARGGAQGRHRRRDPRRSPSRSRRSTRTRSSPARRRELASHHKEGRGAVPSGSGRGILPRVRCRRGWSRGVAGRGSQEHGKRACGCDPQPRSRTGARCTLSAESSRCPARPA